MNIKVRYIMTGLLACAAVSFAGVSCMQFMASDSGSYIDMDTLELVQTEEPEDGAPTATIRTTEGDIKCVLYPEYAPETVEKFTQLAESGYYDNTYIFNSEPGVYFSAGSPLKNGDLDQNKPEGTEEWEQEIHQNLWPFKGALCSLSTGEDGGFWKKLTGDVKVLNGSRFAVLNSSDFTEDFKKSLLESDENQTLANEFIKLGGIPALSQKITVFGQTYQGFDVIEKLTSLETETNDGGLKVPVEDVMIKTIEIGTYDSDKETPENIAAAENEEQSSTESTESVTGEQSASE
ncbi:MAG: peptidylprolyl isomerase [Porcipelethomonas sp.]